MLTEVGRAAAVEQALSQIKRAVPECQFVLLSSAFDQAPQLRNFLQRLGGIQPIEINDSLRPTRRLCGILTAEEIVDAVHHPSLLLFPPYPIVHAVGTKEAYRIVLHKAKVARNKSRTDLAAIFTRHTARAGLRTVFFATNKKSVETQARQLAATSKHFRVLPVEDIERLEAELGQPSQIQGMAAHGVACHHGAMMPIEQQMVEKWLLDGLVHTVVATPTLAQGVNLPFDIALLSYLKRFNQKQQEFDDLAQHEIQNMLGRAGRAGFVTDGISLLAIQRGHESNPIQLLNKHRNTFFGELKNTNRVIGVRRILEVATSINASAPTWLEEYHGFDFADAQSLVSTICGVLAIGAASSEDYLAYLEQLPSVREVIESDSAKARRYVELIKGIAEQLTTRFGDDEVLKNVVMRTGLPVELVRFFVGELRSTPSIRDWILADQLEWYDAIIFRGLTMNISRTWCKELIGPHEPPKVFNTIQAWRSGQTMLTVERALYPSTDLLDDDKCRRDTVEFVRRNLALLAQLWNALAMCDIQLYGEFGTYDSPMGFHTMVREGVSSIQHSMCLHELGGTDRVVSKAVSQEIDIPPRLHDARKAIRRQLSEWRRNNNIIADGHARQYLLPILSLLNS